MEHEGPKIFGILGEKVARLLTNAKCDAIMSVVSARGQSMTVHLTPEMHRNRPLIGGIIAGC